MPRSTAALAALAAWGCGDDLAVRPDALGSLVLRFEPVALEGGAPLAITEIAFIPETSDLLVLSKSRTVTRFRLDDGGASATRIGAFDVPGVDESSDCGLLSVAFDPDFATNHQVYFAACESKTHSRITRHELDPMDYSKIESTAFTVLRVGSDIARVAWHNIGSIGFDENGYLWALFGDKNEAASAQDVSSNLGSVVRIAPDRIADGYAPAPTNPFIGMGAASPDIVAYGLRSPWRGALDDAGRLWIGDVGGEDFEEVNVTRFAGENFGSSLVEGPCTESCDQLVDPLVSWSRSNDLRYAHEDPEAVSTTRRVVWVGAAYPRSVTVDRYAGRLFGRMLVGDFCTGWIRALGLDDGDRLVHDDPAGHLEAATSWTVGPDGYIYASTYGSCLAWPYKQGAVYRAVLAVD